MSIVLASSSRIRQSILKAAGVEFSVRSSGLDEAAIKSQAALEPRDLAVRLAEEKARIVSMETEVSLVIGADQVLALENVVLDKPKDGLEAREHLQLLRGRTHVLHSAVACARGGKILWQHSETARMTMRMFSDSMLDCYISESGEGITSSVGAYKIENRGIQLFENIDGSYFSILGLPLLPLLGFLRDQGELPR